MKIGGECIEFFFMNTGLGKKKEKTPFHAFFTWEWAKNIWAKI
jgi:hypothetical protein